MITCFSIFFSTIILSALVVDSEWGVDSIVVVFEVDEVICFVEEVEDADSVIDEVDEISVSVDAVIFIVDSVSAVDEIVVNVEATSEDSSSSFQVGIVDDEREVIVEGMDDEGSSSITVVDNELAVIVEDGKVDDIIVVILSISFVVGSSVVNSMRISLSSSASPLKCKTFCWSYV